MYGLIKIVIVLLEFLFVTGVIGSLAVIVLSGIEDLEIIFERERPNSPSNSAPSD